jgi:hypothetical protein
MSRAHDTPALRDLAQGWREVSRRNRRWDKDRLLCDDDPGPHMTAIQLEWAAREIERLRAAIQHVISDSPGTPDSVKKYLVRELEGSWGEPYEEAMLG